MNRLCGLRSCLSKNNVTIAIITSCYCNSNVYNDSGFNEIQTMRVKKRAGKLGKYKRQSTNVLSVSLRPASISLLNELAADHGGAGRAIQIAIELLHARKTLIKLREDKSEGLSEPFAFAAFARTEHLMNILASQYGSRSNVIRACIRQLQDLEMQWEDESVNASLAPRYGRDPDDFAG